MARNSLKQNGEGTQRKGKLEDDVDALFKLPLAEFIGARNDLAAQLKRDRRSDDATLVKSLAKPSVTAWAVNQLYWKHHQAFETLLAAGKRFRQVQTSTRSSKAAEMRESLNARREALLVLSELVTSLLSDAGHNPTADTIHRINTTLEAISAHTSPSEGPTLGRLTHDVDPPGFESLASFVPGKRRSEETSAPARVSASPKSGFTATAKARPTPARDARQLKEARQERIGAAKASLQAAKKLLSDARAKAQRLEAAQKKAVTEAKEAEKERCEAEARFKKASAASTETSLRARTMAAELKEASKALEDARRTMEKASKELELLFRES